MSETFMESKKQVIQNVIKDCQENNIMADFLKSHETEVCEMLMREFAIRILFEGKHSEGIKKGIEEGIAVSYRNVAIKMIKANKSDLEIQEMTELSLDEIQKLRDDNVNNI